MAIPKYDEMMLPMLELLSDGLEHAQRDMAPVIGDRFGLSDAERSEMLPKVRVSRLKHRIGWAAFRLRRAGLAEGPRTGTLRITDEGRKFLATRPAQLRAGDLKQFPAWVAFLEDMKRNASSGREDAPTQEEADHGSTETPEERIVGAFTELNATLVTDLLAKLTAVDPYRFEQVVLDLLVAMGYGGSRKEAAEVTQRTGDGGIDGLINEDRLGLDVIYVQAKRWKSNVGRPEIQGFVGALAGRKASKGIFITTSGFVANAFEYAAGLHQKIILIDGKRLAELMVEHDVGVSKGDAHYIKKIDSDYFEES